jgi:hypothetical protein
MTEDEQDESFKWKANMVESQKGSGVVKNPPTTLRRVSMGLPPSR